MLWYLAVAALAILGVGYAAFQHYSERRRAERLSRRKPLSQAEVLLLCRASGVDDAAAIDIVRESIAQALSIPVECVYPGDRFCHEYRLPKASLFLDDSDELLCHELQKRLRDLGCPSLGSMSDIHSVAELIAHVDRRLRHCGRRAVRPT